MDLSTIMQSRSKSLFNKDLKACSNEELYSLLLNLTKGMMARAPKITGDRKLYYISAEFLIGKHSDQPWHLQRVEVNS